MARLAMFVDGWNFYWSLVDAGIKPYGWCNFALLAQQKTGLPNATVNVKYFTSADRPHPEKILDRQKTIWWRALSYLGVQIVEGEFRSTHSEVEQQIREDHKKWREKQTDIALASHMIADCTLIGPDPDRSGARHWTPGYDEAVLLSGDSDFVPAVKILVDEPFGRRVHVLLPPVFGLCAGKCATDLETRVQVQSPRRSTNESRPRKGTASASCHEFTWRESQMPSLLDVAREA